MPEQPAQKTIVCYLLDRNGWMELIKPETIASFNAFVDTLEERAGDRVEFTLMQFNEEAIETLCVSSAPTDAPRLSAETYQPNGGGALLDPFQIAIKMVEQMIIERTDNARVLLVLHVSDDHGWCCLETVELRGVIERRRAEGWQFLLLAAEISGYSVAEFLGIETGATISFSGMAGSVSALTAAAAAAAAFANGRTARICFTAEQKRAAGDRYFEFVISEEAIERAMRVYTVEEAMDELRCTTPSPSATTERWREFLEIMKAGPQTAAALNAIAAAERELAHRANGAEPRQPEPQPAPPSALKAALLRLCRRSDDATPIELPPACRCARLARMPLWARTKMEDAEIACCRLAMPFRVEHADEPPLCRADGDEVYRITYEQAFGEHASIRIARSRHKVRLDRTWHAGRFNEGERFAATLTITEWRQLLDALAAANFWSLPAVVYPESATLDGYELIVEGRRGNLFKATRLINPDIEELWRIGRIAFDIAGLAAARL